MNSLKNLGAALMISGLSACGTEETKAEAETPEVWSGLAPTVSPEQIVQLAQLTTAKVDRPIRPTGAELQTAADAYIDATRDRVRIFSSALSSLNEGKLKCAPTPSGLACDEEVKLQAGAVSVKYTDNQTHGVSPLGKELHLSVDRGDYTFTVNCGDTHRDGGSQHAFYGTVAAKGTTIDIQTLNWHETGNRSPEYSNTKYSSEYEVGALVPAEQALERQCFWHLGSLSQTH